MVKEAKDGPGKSKITIVTCSTYNVTVPITDLVVCAFWMKLLENVSNIIVILGQMICFTLGIGHDRHLFAVCLRSVQITELSTRTGFYLAVCSSSAIQITTTGTNICEKFYHSSVNLVSVRNCALSDSSRA